VNHEESEASFRENNCPWKNWEDCYSYPVSGQLKRCWFSAEPRNLLSITDAVDVDNVDVPVFSPDEAQHSTAQRRICNSVVNWEKVRDKLFMAAVEEESLPEKAVCVVCKQRESTVRCRYCGPRQFFCSTCAHDLHAERNQFHVLEQWKVFSNRHVYTFYVLEMEMYFFVKGVIINNF